MSRCLLDSNIFKERGNKIHNKKFDYSLVNYTGIYNKVKIICQLHGIFEQSPNKHLNAKHGCPKCKSSKAEEKIYNYLTVLKIQTLTQYRFKDCKNIKPLPFDFYLPDHNLCIEYDGEMHFETFRRRTDNKSVLKLKQTQKNDIIKNGYCKEKGIRLLRIPYWEKEKFKELINFSISSIE